MTNRQLKKRPINFLGYPKQKDQSLKAYFLKKIYWLKNDVNTVRSQKSNTVYDSIVVNDAIILQ